MHDCFLADTNFTGPTQGHSVPSKNVWIEGQFKPKSESFCTVERDPRRQRKQTQKMPTLHSITSSELGK